MAEAETTRRRAPWWVAAFAMVAAVASVLLSLAGVWLADPKHLLLIGPLDGDGVRMLLASIAIVGLGVVVLYVASRLTRVAQAALTVAVTAVWLVGAVVVWFGATWNTATYLRYDDPRGGEVVVRAVEFLHTDYRVYSGSGILFTEVTSSLEAASFDPPLMGRDDFDVVEKAGVVVLRYASTAGGPLENEIVIPARNPADEKLGLATPDPNATYTTVLTVIDDGTGPHACLVVLESYPPQCGGGLPLANFDWDTLTDFDREGDVRWGVFELLGSYDGTTLTLTQAPGPGSFPTTPPPPRTGDLTELEANAILNAIREELPDPLGSGSGDGWVSVTVHFDDGSLQDQLDARYGRGAAYVDSILSVAG